jgi:hypothetical protein
MKILFSLAILLAFKGSSGWLAPFSNNKMVPACVEDIKSIYKKQVGLANISSNKNCHLNYDMIVTMNRKKERIRSNVVCYVNKNSSHVITDQMDVFQDKEVIVSVLKEQKTIYINRHPKDMDKIQGSRANQLNLLRDSVFLYSVVKECKNQPTANGQSEWLVQLDFTEGGKKKYKMNRVDFVMDNEKKEIKSFSIYYSDSNTVSTVQCVFNKVDYNYKTDRLSRSPLSIIMNGKNLLPPYAGFKIVDNRKALNSKRK